MTAPDATTDTTTGAGAPPGPLLRSRAVPLRDRLRNERGFLVGLSLITLGALAFRVWYVHSSIGRLTLNGDAFYYHYQAHDIAEGRWFIEPGFYAYTGREMPSAGHPPVYLLYLAFWTRLGIHSETAHRYLSTVLGAGGVFFIGLIGREVWNRRAGLLAASLAAVYAHLWINDEMHMSESAYILTSSAMVWLAYRYWKRPTVARAAWLGAGIAIAALSRAEALALFAFLVIPFMLSRRFSSWRDRLVRLAACWAVGAALLLPWFAYNVTRFEHPVTMSNGIGSVLMVANCDAWVKDGELLFEDAPGADYLGTFEGDFVGYWSIACGRDLREQIDLRFSGERAAELKRELGGDESQREVVWRAIGLWNIEHHLSRLPEAVVARVLRMWDLWYFGSNIRYNAHLEGRGLWQSTLAAVQYLPLLAVSIAGLVILRRHRRAILPFTSIAIVITITAAATFGITRYRAPIDALLPVLAAVAVIHTSDRVRSRRAAPGPR